MKLSIIIPAYNEEETIESTISKLEKYLDNYSDCDWWEIIIVDDGSTDNTLSLLNKKSESMSNLNVLSLGVNSGRGKAIRKGLLAVSGDIVVTLDADLSYAPFHIERMVSKLIKNNAQIVVASAYSPEGKVENVPAKRLWISRLGNKILSFMYQGDISVLTCVVRAYDAAFIKKIDLHSDNKDLHLEILYKAQILGAKILEIPAELKWAKQEKSDQQKAPQRRSTLKLRKTSSSHFFFALINRPGLVFIFPGLFLLCCAFSIIFLCLFHIAPEINEGLSLYSALRQSMLTATPSWLTAMFIFILSIQFFSLGFLSNQSKWNYEESFKTHIAILEELKKAK